jgi:hypothetical protein
LQAVVEGQLIQAITSEPVDATVADVPYQRCLRQQDQHAGRGPHGVEIRVRQPAAVDFRIRIENGLFQSFGGGQLAIVVIQVPDVLDGQFAGQFSRRMRPHPVGDQKRMAAVLPRLLVFGEHNGMRILIVGPAHPDVSSRDVLQA